VSRIRWPSSFRSKIQGYVEWYLLRDVTMYSPIEVHRRFGETYCLHLTLVAAWILLASSLNYPSILKMKSLGSSNISVNLYQATCRYIIENNNSLYLSLWGPQIQRSSVLYTCASLFGHRNESVRISAGTSSILSEVLPWFASVLPIQCLEGASNDGHYRSYNIHSKCPVIQPSGHVSLSYG
jgi:hypothetical protein